MTKEYISQRQADNARAENEKRQKTHSTLNSMNPFHKKKTLVPGLV